MTGRWRRRLAYIWWNTFQLFSFISLRVQYRFQKTCEITGAADWSGGLLDRVSPHLLSCHWLRWHGNPGRAGNTVVDQQIGHMEAKTSTRTHVDTDTCNLCGNPLGMMCGVTKYKKNPWPISTSGGEEKKQQKTKKHEPPFFCTTCLCCNISYSVCVSHEPYVSLTECRTFWTVHFLFPFQTFPLFKSFFINILGGCHVWKMEKPFGGRTQRKSVRKCICKKLTFTFSLRRPPASCWWCRSRRQEEGLEALGPPARGEPCTVTHKWLARNTRRRQKAQDASCGKKRSGD